MPSHLEEKCIAFLTSRVLKKYSHERRCTGPKGNKLQEEIQAYNISPMWEPFQVHSEQSLVVVRFEGSLMTHAPTVGTARVDWVPFYVSKPNRAYLD